MRVISMKWRVAFATLLLKAERAATTVNMAAMPLLSIASLKGVGAKGLTCRVSRNRTQIQVETAELSH